MTDQFLAEIRCVPFNFAPQGWAMCNGQLLPITQNTALFSLLGTQYGGNGTSNFSLPDLRGNVAIGVDALSSIGTTGGAASVTLVTNQMPAHSHNVSTADSLGTTNDPSAGTFAVPNVDPRMWNLYSTEAANSTASGTAIENDGGSQPHNNMQPYLVLTYIIALTGVYPART